MVNVLKYAGQGIYHSDKGTEYQDSLDSRITEYGRIILVLSDGCGSCFHAKTASDAVVNTVMEYYSDKETTLSNDVAAKKRLLELINERLLKKAYEFSYKDTYEFSATMVFAVIEGNYVLIGHIGDGALLCYGENGELLYESAAENGADKYETYFVNSYDALQHFRLDILELEEKSILRNLVMYSDGPEKMFDNHIAKGLNKGAASLVENVRNNNINNCEQLGEYLHGIFSDSLSNAADDWSLIVYDRDQSMCADFNPEPVTMSTIFYDRYLKTYRAIENSIRHMQSAFDSAYESEEPDSESDALEDYDESTRISHAVTSQNKSDIKSADNKKEDENSQNGYDQISFIEKNIEEMYADSEGLAYNFVEIRDGDYPEFETELIGKEYEYPDYGQNEEADDEPADSEYSTVPDEFVKEKKADGIIKSWLKKTFGI